MKKYIYLFALLISATALAQDLGGKPAQLTRKGGRFYLNGAQITTRQVRQTLTSNYEASSLFKKAKNKESFGGILIGLGGALVVADVVVGLVSDVNYPTAATYVGGAALITAIPVLSGKNKKTDKALEIYNNGPQKLGANKTDVELNVIANQRGYGLQLRF